MEDTTFNGDQKALCFEDQKHNLQMMGKEFDIKAVHLEDSWDTHLTNHRSSFGGENKAPQTCDVLLRRVWSPGQEQNVLSCAFASEVLTEI